MLTPFRFRVLALLMLGLSMIAPGVMAQDASPPGVDWPTDGWITVPPESEAMDANLSAEIDARVAAETPLLTSLIVIRNGKLVAERYYNGETPEQPVMVWSVAKSVTSIAVGIAFREGLLTNLDQTLGELIPNDIPANADPRVGNITLHDLLTSTSGWEWDGRINFSRHDETDQLDLMMARPMVCDPGQCFEYDSTNANLLSLIIQRLSGQTMADYLQSRLFDPLGIAKPEWLTTVFGSTRGAGGLWLTPTDMAKLGYLYLNDGMWDGQRIVDAEWVADSTREQASGTSSMSGVNIGGGSYGYQWWVVEAAGHHAYYGNGYGGQLIFGVPNLNLLLVTAVAGTDVNDPQDQQPALPLVEWLVGLAA